MPPRHARHRRHCLQIALLLLAPWLALGAAWAAASRAEVLLVFDPAQPLSVLDAQGIRAALEEQRTPREEWPLSVGQPLGADFLQAFSVVVLAHARLSAAEIAAMEAWLQAGGGLLATGAAGLGLEPALGISPLQPLARSNTSEIRFAREHLVATGSVWRGPISQLPPMPAEQLPAILQLLYRDLNWPAYTATAPAADVLARWRDSNAAWFSNDGAPAVFAHASGIGRSVYIGALPGAYADPAWGYPLAWRTVIEHALQWVNSRGSVIQLGYWPHAHRGALALTADTERAAMATVVPALLGIFERLGLERFGTFFLVGQAGGDPQTEGAVEHPATVAQILAAGAEMAGHGDVHTRFAGQDLGTQTARLQQMLALFAPLLAGSGEQVLGFRAPGLAVDRNTFRAEVAAGMAYDSSEQDVWNEWTLPHFSAGLWHLPVSSPMDYALLHEAGLSGEEWETLTRDKLAYVLSRRGLFNWVVHPWIVANELAHVEAVLGDVLARGDVWLQRLDALLYWWLQREDVDVALLAADADRLQLQISNRGSAPVAGTSLWLRPPRGAPARPASIAGQPVASQLRRHGIGPEAEDFAVLVLPPLAAGQSITLDWGAPRSPLIFASGFEP